MCFWVGADGASAGRIHHCADRPGHLACWPGIAPGSPDPVGRGEVLDLRIVLMIDFRYHLVSIVAIFLALALGLLLGSTVLRPYALKGLEALSKHQKQQIDSLQQTNKQLQSQLASNNQFAQANAPQILHQLLAGQRVVLVLAPGAPGSVVSGVTQNLGLAGAAVTGQLQLQAP